MPSVPRAAHRPDERPAQDEPSLQARTGQHPRTCAQVLQPDAYPGQRHRKLRRLTGLHIKQEDKGTKEGGVQKQVKTNPRPDFR